MPVGAAMYVARLSRPRDDRNVLPIPRLCVEAVMMIYWVIAIAVSCVMPNGDIEPCQMIQNSYLGGHTIFLRKEDCLKDIGDTKRLSCIEIREAK